MSQPWDRRIVVLVGITLLGLAPPALAGGPPAPGSSCGHKGCKDTLYVWGSDVARVHNDFVAVIDFDEHSKTYGAVLSTVEVPTSGNEAHHCGLSADGNVLACGGLLSVLKGQPEVFFFDVSDARNPVYLGSADPPQSSVTDDFVGLEGGGFLVTMMGSASGGAGGRVAEFDADLNLVAEWPAVLPADGTFNPHGISVRPDLDLMVTSDFVNPASTLNVVPGPVELRHAVRVWDLSTRTIVRTVDIPEALGTMDVKLIPGDPEGRAITAGMFDGLVYTIDTDTGTYTPAFDCEDIVPHVESTIEGGMVQLITLPSDGQRMIFVAFDAGQVGMVDISDRYQFSQIGLALDLGGIGAGPHNHVLSPDEERLVVANYFLEEDDFGKIHFEGNHEVHVVQVEDDGLELDPAFALDFDTAFSFGPARPHGIAIKTP